MSRYLWKVEVCEAEGAFGLYFTNLLFEKLFANKNSAMNYMIRKRNSGYYATMTKWFGD